LFLSLLLLTISYLPIIWFTWLTHLTHNNKKRSNSAKKK